MLWTRLRKMDFSHGNCGLNLTSRFVKDYKLCLALIKTNYLICKDLSSTRACEMRFFMNENTPKKRVIRNRKGRKPNFVFQQICQECLFGLSKSDLKFVCSNQSRMSSFISCIHHSQSRMSFNKSADAQSIPPISDRNLLLFSAGFWSFLSHFMCQHLVIRQSYTTACWHLPIQCLWTNLILGYWCGKTRVEWAFFSHLSVVPFSACSPWLDWLTKDFRWRLILALMNAI